MIEDLKNFKVNWIDGMKITKTHFQDLQNYTDARVNDGLASLMPHNNYGLLPAHLGKSSEFAVTVDAHKSLKISIKKLRAITPSGARVEITENTPSVSEEVIVEDFAEKGFKEGYVLLNADPQNAVAFGDQDPKEIPPRHPYLTDGCFFTFSKAKALQKTGLGPFQLPLAKIVREGDTVIAVSDYIPPCTALGAHEGLLNLYHETEDFLKLMERNSILITQKIMTKQSDNPIADAMHIVVDKIYPYMAQQITAVRWDGQHLAPKKVMEILVSLARTFKGAVDVSSPENKEQLFNYFGEWTDMKGGDYEKLFTDMINLEYAHYDIATNLAVTNGFAKVLERLFTILTQVDYIGKRRDMGIFVNENVVRDNPKKSGGPSFLAD